MQFDFNPANSERLETVAKCEVPTGEGETCTFYVTLHRLHNDAGDLVFSVWVDGGLLAEGENHAGYTTAREALVRMGEEADLLYDSPYIY